MSKNRSIILFIFLSLVASSCKLGDNEVVSLNTVGLLVEASTGDVVDEQLIEPGEVFVWKGERLLIFDLGVRSIVLGGNAQTHNSNLVKYRCKIDYHLRKSEIVSLYNRFGEDYEQVFVEPESKKIIREVIARSNSLADVSIVSLESRLRCFYDEHYLVLANVVVE